MSTSQTIRLGTRSSALAQWQAYWTKSQLEALGVTVELIFITTEGDANQGSFGQIGGQGLFTTRIQQALVEKEVDLAVHSLKDLPTQPTPGLGLAAVPVRETTGDALVSSKFNSIDELPQGAVVGTGSLRRQAQLLNHRPDLKLSEVRGNVDTRLRKLDEGQYDALILAEAGLKRLELTERITQIIPRHLMIPAVGQGALGLETRVDDVATSEVVARLDDENTHAAVVAERSMLRELRGGCLAPVGAYARMEEGQLRLEAIVLNAQGSQKVTASLDGTLDQAADIGKRVAADLLSQGAAELIASSRDTRGR